MRSWIARTAVLLATLLVPAAAGAWSAGHNGAPFSLSQEAPGVWVVWSLDPLAFANHSNAVFIVRNSDVVVVNSQFTLERTRMVQDVLIGLTPKPVSTLINTHWHEDCTFGNQVWTGVFPKTQVITQANTREDMAGIAVESRQKQVAAGDRAVRSYINAMQKKVALDGTPMSQDEHDAYESTVELLEEYLNDQAAFTPTLPVKTFDKRMTITAGGRTIELRYFGPAVTNGDAVVYLPKEGLAVVGDLVDNPMPFTAGCDVNGWIAALDSLQALAPSIIVPAHGGPMYDDTKIVLLKRALTAVRDQTAAAVAHGETLEQAQKDVHLDEFRKQMAGDSKMMQDLFDGYFARPAIASAYAAASKARNASP